MSRFNSIDDLGELDGEQVLVRVDLNVPMQKGPDGGRIVSDDTRLRAIAPTLKLLLEKGARVLLLSHFGRPRGCHIPELSIEPLTGALSDILEVPVVFTPGCTASDVGEAVALNPAPVQLLENVRFHPGEEANDKAFALDMAALGTAFVNDAFSAAHRAHASVVGLAEILPAAAGLSLARELSTLEAVLTSPGRPLVAIVGGAKVSTKLKALTNLVDRVDDLIIGGAMANTFLFGLGKPVGASLCERDLAETACEIISRGGEQGHRIHLPQEVVVAGELRAGAETRTIPVGEVGDNDMILDIGPDSVELLKAIVGHGKTLIWNGPLGAFEVPPFDAATTALAREAARLTRAGRLLTLAGGGDTVAALNAAGVKEDFSHVSTAGGAFLEWMEGRELPGIAALEKAVNG